MITNLNQTKVNMKAFKKTLLSLFVLSLCTTAGAIDIKLKKDRATVDGITYAINAKKQTASVVKGQPSCHSSSLLVC